MDLNQLIAQLSAYLDIDYLVSQFGVYFYVVAFVWTFLEGETVILVSGFIASQGRLNPWLLLGSAWFGSFFGDQCYFWVGRCYGLTLLERYPRWRNNVDAALYWLERYNVGFILSFRFIYGVRNISSFAMGLSAIHWFRFLQLNFLAAGLWAASFVFVGFSLGHAFNALLGDLARSFSLVMLGVFVAIGAGMWLLHRVRRRRRRLLRVPAGADVVLPPN
jgi:membrane protein DedA with SNARE-associated domain